MNAALNAPAIHTNTRAINVTIAIRHFVLGAPIAAAIGVLVFATWCFLLLSAISYNVFWSDRYGLLLCSFGVAVALPFGLAQFRGSPQGRYFAAYVASVGVGAAGAFVVAFHAVLGGTFGVAAFAWATAWVATTVTAYGLLRRENIPAHREWLARSYVVTLAFVMFWLLVATPFFSSVALSQRLSTFLWTSWSLPLLVTEIVMQWRRSVAAGRVYFI